MPVINFTSSTFDKKPANTVVVLSPNIIKQGDQKHDLRIQLLRGETPVDLTGKTVLWSAASTKGKFVTDREAEVSTNGEVSLSLVDEDAGAFGELRVEIKVIHEDGKVEKFPANDFARFTITYSLDDITNTPVYFASVAFFEQKVNQAENAAETAKQAAMSAEQRAVYVEQQGDIAESQGLFAQAKATEARDQAALAKQVAEENKTNWKQEVATVVLRNSTYPNPQIGDTVRITGEARIDRFNGTEWITTDRYNPAAIDEVTVKLAEKADKAHSGALLKRTTALSIANATTTTVPWSTSEYDTSAFFKVESPTKLVIPAGVKKVRVSLSVEFEISTTGRKFIRIYKNSTTLTGGARFDVASINDTAATNTFQISTAVVNVVAGDFFEAMAYQNSGSAVSLLPGNGILWFSLEVIE